MIDKAISFYCFAIIVLILLSVTFLFQGCATNPVTKQTEFVLMSEEQEISIGREMNPQILKEYGVYPSDVLQNYVETVGKKVAGVSDRTDLFFHFKVVNSSLVNAFALPGGYVYVTRGLLAYVNSESELAGVLGHEIGHVTARHAVRQYTKAASYNIATGIASIFIPGINNYGQIADIAFVAITSGYSREYEREADQLGIKYALKADYDPTAVSSFLHTLDLLDRVKGEKTYHSLFATHPKTEERISLADSAADLRSIPSKQTLIVGKEAYLNKVDGLLFGPDPREGVIVGNKFQHPDLRIELNFPKGWTVENKPDVVIAKKTDREFYILLRLENLSKKTSAATVASTLSRKLGFSERSGNPAIINGLNAYVGTYEGKSNKLGYITVRAGFILVEDVVHYIIGYSRPEEFPAALPFFNETISSFRTLSLAEAQVIKPTRIRLHTIKAGETLDAMCREKGRPSEEVKTLALINARDPKRPELKPGTVIKVIKNE